MKVMYAGEIHCLFQDGIEIPIIVLYSKESEGYLLLKYFDLKSMKLKSGCLNIIKDVYSIEPYPLYKLDNYKLADMLYHYQTLDKIQTSTYQKFCDLVKLSQGLKGYSNSVNLVINGIGLKEYQIEKIEYQYENELKSICDIFLDALLKEDYLSVLHTHFNK